MEETGGLFPTGRAGNQITPAQGVGGDSKEDNTPKKESFFISHYGHPSSAFKTEEKKKVSAEIGEKYDLSLRHPSELDL